MQKDIRHQWFFNHSPETVWKFLTDPELIAQWLMENDFKPVVGHKFQFTTKPKVKVKFDGIVYCEVLEVKPYTNLSYSWKGGSKGQITLDSVVTWTLTPRDGGTDLVLEHKGFKGMKNYLAYFFMNIGWKAKVMKRFSLLIDSNQK
ncbi:SRPBCC family protein [Sporocytophaga myxococcoides]|uniref:SRPBCC family protein n=1 Tax=Sporocytophaga myxococcoides TaxID=153721 RepID=UPI0003FB412C|nr:SRPBCC domain-containing protein [Sporocytophaga myxococcoides]